MERITYRITLDTHRNGIQRTLQGFETADKMSRRIAVNLVSGGDTYELPMDHTVAIMYVTTPNATEPSINECYIEGNTIIYDALPIVEEGITEMQLKVIKTDIDGAKMVLASPRFAVEVTESGTNDEGGEQTTTFTALEDAIAKANGVYDCRLLRVEIDDDCTFRAYYADGTVYENYFFKEALYNGNALLSESWAKGGTGVREGEDTNNSMYYSNVSRSASEDANMVAEEARVLLNEAIEHSTFTVFSIDFEKGEVTYYSQNYTFDVDEESGEIVVHGDGEYDPDGIIKDIINAYMADKDAEINARFDEFEKEIDNGIDITQAEYDALSDEEKMKGTYYITDGVGGSGSSNIIAWQGAGFHNSIYRGDFLGNSVTDAQYAAIANGTFDDLYIGDYWTINGVNWRIAGFDYYWNSGDGATNSNCTTHHVVIVPDTSLYKYAMDTSNTNSGGYVGSKMYTNGLENAKATIKAIFSGHVLSHRIYLNNSTSGGVWRDSEVDLMNEHMLYGAGIFYTRSGAQHRVEKSQLPLFAHEPSRINIRDNYWLRDITDSSKFAYFAIDGIAGTQVASAEYGVRPAFCIF